MNRKEDTVFCYYAHNSEWTCELGYGADTMFHRTHFLYFINTTCNQVTWNTQGVGLLQRTTQSYWQRHSLQNTYIQRLEQQYIGYSDVTVIYGHDTISMLSGIDIVL